MIVFYCLKNFVKPFDTPSVSERVTEATGAYYTDPNPTVNTFLADFFSMV